MFTAGLWALEEAAQAMVHLEANLLLLGCVTSVQWFNVSELHSVFVGDNGSRCGSAPTAQLVEIETMYGSVCWPRCIMNVVVPLRQDK